MGEKGKSKVLAALCAIYVFFITCTVAIVGVIMGYLPEYFNTTLVSVSLGSSITSLVTVVVSVFAVTIFKKIGNKICLISCSVLMIVYGVMVYIKLYPLSRTF